MGSLLENLKGGRTRKPSGRKSGRSRKGKLSIKGGVRVAARGGRRGGGR